MPLMVVGSFPTMEYDCAMNAECQKASMVIKCYIKVNKLFYIS